MSWKFWNKKRAPLTDDQRAALRRLVSSAKYELIPLDSILAKADALPEGSAVTVTASPSHGIEATFDLSEKLAARGHDVTPHLSAHMIRDRAHLQELLERARAASITKAFVVGGDARDKGEFHDGVALLQAIDELGHPFTDIGVPSYPEGHPDIADDVLLAALHEKQKTATSMTTQMCFNPEALSSWLTRMRAAGITLPVHLGVPGVAELTKLMAISARIGVADSARYLKKNKSMVGHLMRGGSFGPDAFLEALAPTLMDREAHVEALHVFTFNQVANTADWQRRMLNGELTA
ncbi:MAG TPA: methylenetetrahydrofolate reductase [Actinomycetota bacterium]|jgi:methylenetetrahydrofolate reductase (NADPH)|nr:methylenetetrahydrofolate reductase [Actinomycetota bacterium]